MSIKINLTVQAIQRLPYYLQVLKKASEKGVKKISATTIADELKLNDVVVRKDISAVCTTKGKPKSGFIVDELVNNIEEYLGYNNTADAVLVGVGSLGKALLGNNEFEKYGLNIVAGFDNNESLVDEIVSGKTVYSLEKLHDFCQRMKIRIGIITVPAESAQEIADKLIESGVKAIWNFALVKIKVPNHVLVQNENLAASLALLSQHLKDEFESGKEASN